MNDLKSHVGGVIDILDRGSTPLTSTFARGCQGFDRVYGT